MLPNFFIVGAAKSGTTALYHYLDRHPEVYMSPIKEPNHFCTDIKPENFSEEFILHERLKNIDLQNYLSGPMKVKHWGYFVQKTDDYMKLFKNVTTEKAVGEVSNSYLFSKEAARNIHDRIPGAKIIIMLRDPALRAYSHYQANLRDGKTYLPFRREIDRDSVAAPKGWGQTYLYLEMGYYYEQVRRYTSLFPASQVKIFLYDDFVKDAATVMNELYHFIGVSSNDSLDYKMKFNEAKEPVNSRMLYLLSKYGLKKRVFHAIPLFLQKRVKNLFFSHKKPSPINKEDRKFLVELYADDIRQLGVLINRDLNSWLK